MRFRSFPHETAIFISRLGDWAWLPCSPDEGSYSPGDHDCATTSYRAWQWLWFRIVFKRHT